MKNILHESFPWKLFRRFLAGQLITITFILVLSGAVTRSIFKNGYTELASEQIYSLAHRYEEKIVKNQTTGFCDEGLGFVTSKSSLPSLHRLIDLKSGKILCVSKQFLDYYQPKKLEKLKTLSGLPDYEWTSFSDRKSQEDYFVYSKVYFESKNLLLELIVPLPWLTRALGIFDQTLVVLLVLLTALFLFYSFVFGRRLMFPLGKLLIKARRTLKSDWSQSNTAQKEESEEEWVDLEDALDHIRRDLKRKTESLTQEREELTTLLAALTDGIVAVDAQGRALFFNPSFAILFGRKSWKDEKPMIWDVFPQPEIQEMFKSVLRDGIPKTVETMCKIRKDPNLYHFTISASPLVNENGKIYGVVGIFHDINELKKSEQIRIDFVANVSHELRTPLTSIKGYADTMKLDLESKRYDDFPTFLGVIERNTQRLMLLLEDLLDLSALDSGTQIHKQLIHPLELTQKVVSNLESRIKTKDHTLLIQSEVDTLEADPKRVEQVITNLIENAIKYIPTRGRIEIHWKKEGEFVFLSIKDNGPGIPKEFQARLFERFFRVDKGRSREMGGTGLGLAIVKHIMQRHGGNVWVESELGKGSKFICQFPV